MFQSYAMWTWRSVLCLMWNQVLGRAARLQLTAAGKEWLGIPRTLTETSRLTAPACTSSRRERPHSAGFCRCAGIAQSFKSWWLSERSVLTVSFLCSLLLSSPFGMHWVHFWQEGLPGVSWEKYPRSWNPETVSALHILWGWGSGNGKIEENWTLWYF
jgi:hypothetical protein